MEKKYGLGSVDIQLMKGYEFINQLKDVTYINVIEYIGQIHKNLPCVYRSI